MAWNKITRSVKSAMTIKGETNLKIQPKIF